MYGKVRVCTYVLHYVWYIWWSFSVLYEVGYIAVRCLVKASTVCSVIYGGRLLVDCTKKARWPLNVGGKHRAVQRRLALGYRCVVEVCSCCTYLYGVCWQCCPLESDNVLYSIINAIYCTVQRVISSALYRGCADRRERETTVAVRCTERETSSTLYGERD